MKLSEQKLGWVVIGFCGLAAIRVFVFAAAFPFFNNVDEQPHVDLVVKYAHAKPPRSIEPFASEAALCFTVYGTPEYLSAPAAQPEADSVNDAYKKAASAAGIAHVSTHSMRHTYRSWLDAVGTPIPVQQKLMRHADIRTTMNVYGDVVTDEMASAASKVAVLALNGSQADRKAS